MTEDNAIPNPPVGSKRLFWARVLILLAGLSFACSILTLMLGGWREHRSIDSVRRTAASLWGADTSAPTKLFRLEDALQAADDKWTTKEMFLRTSGWIAWLALGITLNGLGVSMLRADRRLRSSPGS